jgi:hypothetical protein
MITGFNLEAGEEKIIVKITTLLGTISRGSFPNSECQAGSRSIHRYTVDTFYIHSIDVDMGPAPGRTDKMINDQIYIAFSLFLENVEKENTLKLQRLDG